MDRTKRLGDYLEGDSVLYFKDLGAQVSWTTVFLVEYAGPILITLILILFQQQIYGKTAPYTLNQKLGIGMVLGHYLKREYETLYVHRFSNDTMPFMNIFKNSTHYWLFFGVFNMYFYLHPDYTAPAWICCDTINYCFLAAFVLFEGLNFMCHKTLRNLRKPGTTERGIPKGWGFGMVSCANYFWEALCWITFSIHAQVLGAWFFTFVSVAQMAQWALKKHRNYRKEFKDYPRKRKAMFPFLL